MSSGNDGSEVPDKQWVVKNVKNGEGAHILTKLNMPFGWCNDVRRVLCKSKKLEAISTDLNRGM